MSQLDVTLPGLSLPSLFFPLSAVDATKTHSEQEPVGYGWTDDGPLWKQPRSVIMICLLLFFLCHCIYLSMSFGPF